MTASVLAGLGTGGGRVAVPLFALELGASSLTVGVIMACFAVLSTFLSIPCGRLVDRVGPRWPVVIGLAGQATALLIPSLWHSLWALAIGAAVMGPSSALFLIAMNNAVGLVSNDTSRAGNYSWIGMTQATSQFAGPPLAGLLIDHGGHPLAFAVLCGIGSMTALLLAAMRRRIPTGGSAAPSRKARLAELLMHPGLRPVFVACGLPPFSWELFFFYVPVHGHELGLSATAIGVVFTSMSITVFASRAAVPWTLKRVGEWPLLAAAQFSAGIVFLLFPFTGNVVQMVLLAGVLGAGMGPSLPVALSLLHRTAPPGRQGEALGVRSTMINSAQVVAPLMLGGLSATLGLAAALLPFSLMLLAGSRYTYTRGSGRA